MTTLPRTLFGTLLFAAAAGLACNSAPAMPTTPNGPEQVSPVGDSIVQVDSSQYKVIPFTVADRKLGTTDIVGRFSAQGGQDNKIVAFVTDDAGVAALKAGKQPSADYYSGGPVVQDSIELNTLSAGVHYLVFDDRYANDGNKEVEDHIVMRFQPMK